MSLKDLIEEAMEVLASKAGGISVEKAIIMRASTGPGEQELVVQFNDALAWVKVLVPQYRPY